MSTSDHPPNYPPISHRNNWDPIKDAETGEPLKSTITRIKRDLMTMFQDPPPGIYVVGDETNLKFIHAVIVGVLGTPYEGGFFYFILKCPNNYPLEPPKIKLMTTDAGKVRFNPNLYNNGKVCLSILGTWEGPAWSPAQQLSGVLISIQSLMSENPYFNEPGFLRERVPGDSKNYNEIIRHETMRVAVCGMLENECQIILPQSLRDIMESSFLNFYEMYVDNVTSRLYLDETTVNEPFSREVFRFQYKRILERLQALYTKLSNKKQSSLNNDSQSQSDDSYHSNSDSDHSNSGEKVRSSEDT